MSTLTVGTISEKVTDAGVSVDGVTLKDGGAVFTSAVTATDNTVDLGASSTRFKDLYLSGGVYLGGTVANNLLEDYETGTWTPVVSTSSGSAGTASFSQSIYTKIGRMVFIHCHCNNIDKTGTTSTAQFRITGLPFTIDSGSTAGSAIGDNITFEGSRTQLMTYYDTNEYIIFRQIGTGVGDATLDYAQLSSANTSDIFFSGFYYTNE